MLDAPTDYHSWEEEDITKRLKIVMRKLPIIRTERIWVDREYYLDEDDDFAGTKGAKKADRIDFLFLSWSQQEDVQYFGEAKNLSAKTWYKNPEAGTNRVNAGSYYKRYIETGIQRVVSGKYSHLHAFLIGYIMNGHTPEIVTKLNQMIQAQELSPEIGLIENRKTFCEHPDCYTSNNIPRGIPKRLIHIFLDFTPSS